MEGLSRAWRENCLGSVSLCWRVEVGRLLDGESGSGETLVWGIFDCTLHFALLWQARKQLPGGFTDDALR